MELSPIAGLTQALIRSFWKTTLVTATHKPLSYLSNRQVHEIYETIPSNFREESLPRNLSLNPSTLLFRVTMKKQRCSNQAVKKDFVAKIGGT